MSFEIPFKSTPPDIELTIAKQEQIFTMGASTMRRKFSTIAKNSIIDAFATAALVIAPFIMYIALITGANVFIDEHKTLIYLIQMSIITSTELKTVIEKLLGTAEFDTSAGILANERQYACCTSAADSLNEALTGLEIGVTLDAVNVSIDYATEKLLELTGEKAREAVVNEVFSKFCVGK